MLRFAAYPLSGTVDPPHHTGSAASSPCHLCPAQFAEQACPPRRTRWPASARRRARAPSPDAHRLAQNVQSACRLAACHARASVEIVERQQAAIRPAIADNEFSRLVAFTYVFGDCLSRRIWFIRPHQSTEHTATLATLNALIKHLWVRFISASQIGGN